MPLRKSPVAEDAPAGQPSDYIHPLRYLEPAAQVGAFAGLGGLLVGSVAGTLTSPNPVLFALFSGAQWFTIGSSFWATRLFAVDVWNPSRERKPYATAVAGSVSGATTAAIFRGRANILPGMLVFGTVSFAAQHLLNAFDTDRTVDSVTGEPVPQTKQSLIKRFTEKSWSPIKSLSDEDYIAILQQNKLKLDVEIAVIDDDIAKLRREASAAQAPSGNPTSGSE